MSAKIKEAKRRLYAELLSVPHGELTDTEIELIYQLALDPQMQDLLDDAREKAPVERKPL